MQSAKDFLQAEVDKKLAEASTIIDTAQKAARSLVPEERQRVETLTEEVTGLKARVQEIEDNEKLTDQIERMRGPINEPAEQLETSTKGSLGDAFIKSDAYGALKTGFKTGQMSGNWTSGPVELPFEAKATVTTTASPIGQPDTQGGIQGLPLRRLTIADLLASGTTDGGTVRYIQETSNTNAAAAVAEGDLKPESTIVFDQVDEPVRKIATFLPVSDEMLEDEAQLRSYLDGRLRLFVQHEEEDQLLNGSGTAPNLTGLLNRTGIQTEAVPATGAGALIEYLYTAITNVRVNGLLEPDGIVMNPTDWARVRTATDANGQYFGGGPFTGTYGQGGLAPDNVWGLPVAVTPAVTAGTALVGAFQSAAQIFRRGGLTVEASNSHSDFFQRNLTAIRAEERLALAVYRPAAFYSLTGLDNATA